jgi:peptidoglycan/xylan/chitin deacetylase (PgdA/CDA1 family)
MEWLRARGYVGRSLSDFVSTLARPLSRPAKAVVLSFDDGYADLVEHAFPLLERYGFGATVFVVTGETGGASTWDRPDGFEPYPLLTAAQIRHWHRRSVDDDRLREETAGSHAELESIVGATVSSFAYPYGLVDERVVARVRQRFAAAATVSEGLNDAATDRHRLRRTMVRPTDSLRQFARRVRFGTSRPARRYLSRLRDRLSWR